MEHRLFLAALLRKQVSQVSRRVLSERMNVLYSVFTTEGMKNVRQTIRLLDFTHFIHVVQLGRREEPTRKSMTVAALILSSYLTPFVILSM